MFGEKKRLSPADMRQGKKLFGSDPAIEFKTVGYEGKIYNNIRDKNRTMKQTDKMRELFRLHPKNFNIIVSKYADAEARGEVKRKSNKRQMDAHEYAKRLLADGLKNGWLCDYP
jgi:hypothetical protein